MTRRGRRSRPPQRRQRILDAPKRILLRESQVQPLLLVVENLPWIDAETQTVLEHSSRASPAALFLLTTYRPEYRTRMGQQDLLHAAAPVPAPRASAQDPRRGAPWGRRRRSSRSSSA